MFLLAKVVECEGLDSERFNITGQIRTLIDLGGAGYTPHIVHE